MAGETMVRTSRKDAVNAEIKLPAPGRCIYCGDPNADTDEHIIPRGLNGLVVWKDASCKRCAAITSRFEGDVLGGFLKKPRTALNMKSYRKKAKTIRTQVKQDDGSFVDVDLPRNEYPVLLALPVFTVPPVMSGEKFDQGRPLRIALQNPAVDLDGNPFVPQQGMTIQEIAPLRIGSFMRMLAKIAHGTAATTFGEEYEPLLVDYILTGEPDMSDYIGTEEEDPDAEQWLGATAVGSVAPELPDHILVGIKILNGPAYLVVPGKFRPKGWQAMAPAAFQELLDNRVLEAIDRLPERPLFDPTA